MIWAQVLPLGVPAVAGSIIGINAFNQPDVEALSNTQSNF
jgi:hypothetical protein